MSTQDSLPRPKLTGILFVIVLASLAVYANTLFNGFVYDDEYQVLKNPWITDFRYIPTVFTSEVWAFQGAPLSNYYRPLLHVLYMLAYHLFGLRAWGFHAVNIFLHAGVSVLVFLLIYNELADCELKTRLFASCAASALFITHPIHTDAVVPVMSVTDLSLAFFYILSLYTHIRCRRKGHQACFFPAVFFFLATLCKETALTLPLVIFAYDRFACRQETTFVALCKRYAPYLMVAAIYFMIRMYALGSIVPINKQPGLNFYQCVLNVSPLMAQYILKLLLPINLNARYEFHPYTSFFDMKVMLSVAMMLFLAFALYKSARTEKIVFFGLSFLIIPLLPTLYVRAIPCPFAERYLYLPSVGFVLIIAVFLARVVATRPGYAVILQVMLALVIGLCTVGTIRRNAVWRDNYSLWSDTVTKSPNDPFVRNNLGLALANQGRLEEAIVQYSEALRLNPDDDFTHYNLGIALAKQGKLEEAISHYSEALRINPSDEETRALLEFTITQLRNSKARPSHP